MKTLKDLEFEEDGFYENEEELIKMRLKAEAVKWVKRFKDPLRSADYSQEIKWIKHFFNLTEEDLE